MNFNNGCFCMLNILWWFAHRVRSELSRENTPVFLALARRVPSPPFCGVPVGLLDSSGGGGALAGSLGG